MLCPGMTNAASSTGRWREIKSVSCFYCVMLPSILEEYQILTETCGENVSRHSEMELPREIVAVISKYSKRCSTITWHRRESEKIKLIKVAPDSSNCVK